MTYYRRAKTPRKVDVVVESANGASVDELMALSGASRRTISRMRAEPAFKAEEAEAPLELIRQGAGKLAAKQAEAVSVVVAIMNDPEQPAAARIAAVRIVLEHPLRVREIVELLARVAELEAAFAARTAGTGPARGFPLQEAS